MKPLFFILLLFLPLYASMGAVDFAPQDEGVNGGMIQPDSGQYNYDHLPNQEMLLTSAQSIIITGDDSGNGSSVRTHYGGHTHHGAKSPFRYVRDGKVTDLHHHPSLKKVLRQLSGDLAADRYLYTVCQLRI